MKKIFTYYANSGDWNGYHTEYVIAESAEEIMQSKKYIDYQNFGYSPTEPKELNSQDICYALHIFGEYNDKIKFTYELEGNEIKCQ